MVHLPSLAARVRISARAEPMTVTLRPATAADAAAICAIHNEGIVDRVATLDTDLRTPEIIRRWLDDRSPRHPVVVAEINEGIVGWGSLNRFNPRAAYDHVADFSVYVARHRRGQGFGRQILDRLIALGREHGFHKLVLSALASNRAGFALYERAGFAHVGVYREQGLIDGRWADVAVMERLL
ncbi:MAG TPA: arsinothricin resistance N-acetyltransferase ArsN1 family A [Vicinamibacterales bacterium]|nr:arsinothricin resistance N-acetyltransferase ArsN1 family A [Vicinamibacterales bacterium]